MYRILLFISFVILLIGVIAWYFGLILNNADKYSFQPILTNPENAASFFCREGEIVKNNEIHIVTLRLCEDGIKSIKEVRGWVVVKTRLGRTYKQNLETGEEILEGNDYGPGGLSIVKEK